MKRCLVIALFLASCTKAGKDAAPASTPAEGDKAAPEAPMQQQPIVGGAEPEPSTGAPPPPNALEAARAGGGLGVSAPTTAFDPLPDDGAAADRPAEATRAPAKEAKPDPKGATGGSARPQAAQGAQIGDVLVDGKPAPAALVQAVKVRVSDVQACYDRTAKLGLTGTLSLAFTVLPSGALSAVSVASSTVKNVDLESCVIGVLQQTKLAKPLGTAETKATVAIRFAPR